MNSIQDYKSMDRQDVRDMGQQLYEYVGAYLRGDIPEDASLSIYSFFNNVVVAIGYELKGDVCYTMKRYPFKELVRPDDIGGMEPDEQKLWSIAEEWLT